MVMRGATRPEAQAAAVTSVVTRHGRSLVFRLCSLRGMIEGGFGGARETMTFGGASSWFSFLIVSSRPFRLMLRVITRRTNGGLWNVPSQAPSFGGSEEDEKMTRRLNKQFPARG